jgi:glycerol-3-phosphate dehydrogenase
VDELCDEARMTGVKGIYRQARSHPLNQKQVAIHHSKLMGRKYEESNYIILHKRMGRLLPMPVYPVPSNTYMGIHITPTVDGNVTIGPDAENTDVLDDYSVPQGAVTFLATEGAKLWPHINPADQIRTFAGIQPKLVDENGAIQDWKVEIRDDTAPNAVNLIGIESPGLTGSVPLARYVIRMMQERETFRENPAFNPVHKGIVRFSACTREEQEKLIRSNPDYGEIICSCEEITKAEILQAIHNPLGVSTMTGIKYRTRAMMGGCQGGFCQAKIEQLIERELGKDPADVVYSRSGSYVVTGPMRKENENDR